jgi:uncharacterized protein (TIGR03437 family)
MFACCAVLAARAFAACAAFPEGLIPLTSVTYVTAANSSGDQLVVGALAGGVNTLSRLPLPTEANQTYCEPVELAPGQFYPNVYVPTQEERTGNFAAFSGLLINPTNGRPYDGGVIPPGQLPGVYPFRIAPTKASQPVKEWSRTGSTATAPTPVAVLLPTGKVLVLGNTPQAQIYDPETGTFTDTGPTIAPHGANVTGVRLNDGRVLVVGGGQAPSAVEIYDPATGSFTLVGSTLEPHGGFATANVLPDGRVLIVGGCGGPCGAAVVASAGAEIFDPATRTFRTASGTPARRNRHTATTLLDGRVLVAGGVVGAQQLPTETAEIFDPATNRFTSVGAMSVARGSHVAVLLPNGKVLIAGGFGAGSGSAELFDPLSGRFDPTGGTKFPRDSSAAALLNNGQVLISGGYDPSPVGSASAELYNPVSGAFTRAGDMYFPRAYFTATALLDGRVLIAGGNSVCCSTRVAPAELYTPLTQGLVTSQSGLTFRAAQGASAAPPQTISVLSPADPIPWNVSVKTYSGGNWLRATPSAGTSTPAGAAVPLTITVDPAGLAPQDYYGAVTLTPTDQKHPPVTVSVVFNIVPAGAPAPLQVSPAGLVFLATVGASPAPQSFSISNFTSQAVNFAASSPAAFFDFTPLSGAVPAAGAATIRVTPSASALTGGVYRNSISLNFGDGSSQRVDVLLVVAPAGAVRGARPADAVCTPARLLPVITSLGGGATAPVAWPAAILVQLVDDCGTAVDQAAVTASFTNGDAPISLLGVGGGQWSGTWVPVRESASTLVRVDARTLTPPLSGTVQIPVRVSRNPNVPLVAAGGVLSSGDYISPPAAGLLVSLFGSELADGAAGALSLPLPRQLGSTRVFLGPSELPLVYVSPNQVNVLVPYDTPRNAPLPLVVTRGGATSVPVTTAVFDAQPAILAIAGNGAGQGHIYRVDASGAQILASADAPATAGDVLVIYCVGLGPVTPAAVAGEPAPASPLATVAAPVTVTIGGQTAQPLFAGLTPGLTGLYQVNVVVPAGIAPGAQVPVSVSAGGRTSPGAIFMGVK